MQNSDSYKTNLSNITFDQLKQIFENSYDGILVTDASGEILFATPSAAVYMGIPLHDLIGKNVKSLVDEGIYNQSIAAKAIEQHKQQSGVVLTAAGKQVFSTATPFFDEQGEISMVITNVRAENILDQYLQALKHLKSINKHYRSALNYLNQLNTTSQQVITESPKMLSILDYLDKISKTNSTVLLMGESGTGKEVLSKYIHNQSNRRDEPFIPVNCAAIPKDLLESEFFGYEKGAFTGALATGKSGFFEMADRGTLFLDEIGELPLEMQSKLLRSIELKEIQKIGCKSVIKTDVRIIAATNQRLEDMVENGTFRKDLYYRLNVIPIHIPPLRERKEDIPALTKHFLSAHLDPETCEEALNSGIMTILLNYDWPGNIRELKNVIERVAINLSIDSSTVDQLINFPILNEFQPVSAVSKKQLNTSDMPDNLPVEDLKQHMEYVEKNYILFALKQNDWNVSQTAKKLGIHRSLLYRKMQSLEIQKDFKKDLHK